MGNKESSNEVESNVGKLVLTEETIIYLMEITSFNRNEIINWHEGFIRDCPKGRLNKKKFIEVYKVFYPPGKADKFCSLVFKVFDCDNSGYIDFTELLIAISITAQGDACKKLTLAFKMVSLVILKILQYNFFNFLILPNKYDIDKNGQLDKKEMELIIEAIYDLMDEDNRKGENAPKERVKQIMRQLDKDHSGSLSQDEFVQGIFIIG